MRLRPPWHNLHQFIPPEVPWNVGPSACKLLYIAGIVLAAVVAVIAALGLGRRGHWWVRVVTMLALALALGAVAVALTGSRVAQVALGAALGAVVLARTLPWWVLVVPLLSVLTTLALPSGSRWARAASDSSMGLWIDLWRGAQALIQDHPWSGVGTNALELMNRWYLSDRAWDCFGTCLNEVLTIAVWWGLPLEVEARPGCESHGVHGAEALWRLLDHRLPGDGQPWCIRGDISYGNETMIAGCEARRRDFHFNLGKSSGVKALIDEPDDGQHTWGDASHGWQGSELQAQLTNWTQFRRLIVIHRPIVHLKTPVIAGHQLASAEPNCAPMTAASTLSSPPPSSIPSAPSPNSTATGPTAKCLR